MSNKNEIYEDNICRNYGPKATLAQVNHKICILIQNSNLNNRYIEYQMYRLWQL